MKKTIVLLLAIVSVVALFSFAPEAKQSKKKHKTGKVWWNFDGTSLAEQQYNWYYSLDDNNFPDCAIIPPTQIYCEIYADPDPESES